MSSVRRIYRLLVPLALSLTAALPLAAAARSTMAWSAG